MILKNYASKDKIAEKLRNLDDEFDSGSRSNDSLALWQFCHDIKIADKIFVKNGTKTVLGVGEVISDYEFKHVRKVKWIKMGHWVVEDKFAIKTLNNITAYEDFLKGINQLVGIEKQELNEWDSYSKGEFLSSIFIDESQYDTLARVLKRKKNAIIQGALGVGKTFAAKRLAYSLIGESDNWRVKLVQFHQSYS